MHINKKALVWSILISEKRRKQLELTQKQLEEEQKLKIESFFDEEIIKREMTDVNRIREDQPLVQQLIDSLEKLHLSEQNVLDGKKKYLDWYCFKLI